MAYFNKADILIPKNIKDNWAVIACDQYTSQSDYWENVKKAVGNDVSTLNLILPEIYLDNNTQDKIKRVNQTMKDYLDNGVFDEYKDSMVFVKRTQNNGEVMDGIIGTLNLDEYDYTNGAKSVTRATEQTVLERIPPRVAIRKDAVLEFPHILILIDDPNFTVIEPLNEKANDNNKLYDLNLMMNGGNVKGYLLDDQTITSVQNALNDLIKNSDDNFLFAVGDGNHSLATAKECTTLSNSPLAKQALVEIVNIHSKAIQFEPIYRVLFGCDVNKVINDFIVDNGGEYNGDDKQVFNICYGENERQIGIKPTAKLPVGTLQSYLDNYLKENNNIKIDYIHGIDSVKELCKNNNTVGFVFEGMKKDELFEAIKIDGSLPRKTFSMGHAEDKKYYVEGRRIK